MPSFTPGLDLALHRALTFANENCHEYTTLEHLLLALIEEEDAAAVLRACGVDLHILATRLKNYIQSELDKQVMVDSTDTKPTTAFQRVIQRAVIHAQSANKENVTGANVLVAFFAERESHAAFFLQEQEMTRYDAINYLSYGIAKVSDIPESMIFYENFHTNDDDEADDKKTLDALSSYCVNLNELAKEGKIDQLIGRHKEVNRTIQILCRRSKNNPLYVGEPGVGKTAIAEGLAKRIVDKQVPKILAEATIFSLDIGILIAGTRYRGDFEDRLKQVVSELGKSPGAILFIDEIHTIIGAGATSGGTMDAANLLKPALASGAIRCIGSTTYKEYRQIFEKDRALIRRFQKIDVKEPTISEAYDIIKGLKPYFENYHNVKFTDEALKAAVDLSARYISDRQLPDKAIDVIDETGAAQVLLSEKKRKKNISSKEIEATIASMAHIPSKTVSRDDTKILSNLFSELSRVVYGQDQAIEALTSSIKLSRAGLREPNKPIGSYLFSGPTGVGKTEVAKQLASSLGVQLLRFDMSEYMEQHSVSRLIGAPPGYVGYDQGGLITDAVDQNRHAVLLLDEIEKAHPDIYNVLLQVMDNGKLTDHNGKQIDFRNIILIMTTNAGASQLEKAAIGFGDVKRYGDDIEAINRQFSPEFRNRLDAIIPFNSLTIPVVYQVVQKFIIQLEAQLADRGITFDPTDSAITWLANKGYDSHMGARPLSRIIQEYIKKPLADEILFGKLRKGGTVRVGLNQDNSAIVLEISSTDALIRAPKSMNKIYE